MYFLIISITVIFDKRDNFLLKYFISVLLCYLASSCVVNNDDHRNIFGFKEIVFNFFYSFLEIDLYQFDIYFVLHTFGVFINNLVIKVTVWGMISSGMPQCNFSYMYRGNLSDNSMD